MAKIIGTVKSISGKASVTRGGNQVHPLKAGEVLHENDIIQTLQAGAKVVLTLEGGRELTLNGNDQILLDESVFAVLEEGEVIDGKALHQLIADKFGNPAETAAGDTTTSEANAGAEYASRNDARGSTDSSGTFMDDESSALGVNFNAIQNENFQPVVSDVSEITAETDGIQTFSGELEVFDPDNVPGSHIFQQTGDATVLASNEVVQVTDFSVEVDPDGAYRVNGNFDALAAGETATVTFTYTATDNSGADNATSEAKTVTLTVTGTNDQPVVSDVNANITGSAEVIGLNSLTNTDIEISPFGESNTAYYAQSFLATNSSLSNVQFIMNDYNFNDDTTNFHILITELIEDSSGLRPGKILFESETLSTNNGEITNFSVDLNSVNLTIGDKYAIVFDAEISFDGQYGVSTVAAGYNIDSNGDFFYLNSDASSDRATDFNVSNWTEWINSYDMGLILTYGNGETVLFETNSIQTISPEQTLLELSGLIDIDTTDTHTFQLATDTLIEVTTSNGATITDLQVLITNENTGAYSITGNFDHLAAGETATLRFQYTATDDSGAENATSEAKTVTLTVTGTNDQPVVSDVNVNGNSSTGTILEESHNITASGEGTIGYSYFTIHETTTITITTDGPTIDPVLYLLRNDGTLTTDDYIASNDDGGTPSGGGFNNSIITYTLAAGEYVVAVSDYALDLAEVIAGVNDTSALGTFTGIVSLNFTSNHPVTLHDSNFNAIYETNGIETIYTGQLELTSDLDTSDIHTFQLVADTVTVDTESGALITDLGVTVAANGGYTVNGNFDALAEGETATVTFQYVANDGKGFDGTDGINESSISAPKTITLIVTGTNDAPVAISSDTTATEDTIINGNVSATDMDKGETSTLTYSLVDPAPVGLTFNTNGSYSFDANSYDYLSKDETQELKIAFTATDIHNATSSVAYLTITITGTNDAPIAVNDEVTESYTVSSINYGGSNGWNGVTITPIGGALYNNNGQLGVRFNLLDDRSIDNSTPGTDEAIQLKFTNLLQHAEINLGGFNTQLIDLPVAGRDTVVWTAMMGATVIASGIYTGGDDSILVIDTGVRVFDTLIIGTPAGSGSDFYIDSIQGYSVDINSALTLMKNTALTIEESYLIDNDTDIDHNDILNITAINSTGTIGEVHLDTDGNVIYDPVGRFDHLAAGEIAHDTFTYTLSDGIEESTATVTVNIIGSDSANDGSVTMLASSLSNYDGGDGYDSVTLTSIFGQTLDFDDISSKLHNIEHLDFNSLIGKMTINDITPDNVANMTDSDHVLKISGEADDTLQLSGFTKDEAASANLEGYNIYSGTSTGGAEITLHIDQDITHIIP